MSWFKRRPKVKSSVKTQPTKTSPLVDKLLKEIKEKVHLGGSMTTGVKTEPD
jgi:hypothetical protein